MRRFCPDPLYSRHDVQTGDYIADDGRVDCSAQTVTKINGQQLKPRSSSARWRFRIIEAVVSHRVRETPYYCGSGPVNDITA